MDKQARLAALKTSAKVSIFMGQIRTGKTIFDQPRNSLQSIGFTIFFVLLGVSLFLALLATLSSQNPSWSFFFLFIAERLPFLLSTAFLILGACLYSDWRSRREISFDLINEVNSEEFMFLRYRLLDLMRQADGKYDVEEMKGWFPTGSPYRPRKHVEEKDDFEEFKRDHAIANMAYFMYRVHVYNQNHMLDKASTRSLLHFFVLIMKYL